MIIIYIQIFHGPEELRAECDTILDRKVKHIFLLIKLTCQLMIKMKI